MDALGIGFGSTSTIQPWTWWMTEVSCVCFVASHPTPACVWSARSSLRPFVPMQCCAHMCVCVICALVSFPPVNITITAKGYSYEHEEPLTTLTLTSPFVKSGVVRCQLVVFVWCVQLDVGAAAVVVGVVVFTNVGASLYHH